MQLYSYQQRVLEAIANDPSHSQLISMPTGTGKTITFLHAIRSQKKRCLLLVHREELLKQSYEKALLCGFNAEEISLIRSSKKDPFSLLTIAMVQTLVKNLNDYRSEDVEMVVVDEAHHTPAKSYMDILHFFKVFDQKKLLLGFTATPLRGDKKQLENIFCSHSFKMTLSEATQNGYICPVHGLRVELEKTLANIDSKGGDYDLSALDHIMNCDVINDIVADKLEHSSRKPGIIFCVSILHAKAVASKLRKKKLRAISISYKTSKRALDRIFGLLRSGRIDYISNAVKLSEGFDFPALESIIMLRPTRSPVLYKQMIGRGLRRSKDKHDCLVIEFAGNDPKMICWDDIDENCTFQASSSSDIKSRSEAKTFYKQRFRSPAIAVIDVRVSHFKFYECKIRRLIKFRKKFRYVPFDEGFVVFEFKPINVTGGTFYNNFCYMCMWKDPYKSFYIWNEGDLHFTQLGRTMQELEKMCLWYAESQPNGGLGKWYPSEEEPMTGKQRFLLPKTLTMSARKAEMFLEDRTIKKAITNFWIDQDYCPGKKTYVL